MTAMTLQVSPIQWGSLVDIDGVEPINDADIECLTEVREVLKKYGMRERFGIALLHKHFDLAKEEMLVEYTDAKNRTTIIKPVGRNEIGEAIPTIWMLQDEENSPMLECRQLCSKRDGVHDPRHTVDQSR